MAKQLRRYLKFLFAFVLLFLLVYAVDLKELWQALSQLTLEAVVYLLLLSVVLIYISALKWQLFLSALDTPQTLWRLFKLYHVGYFVNQVIPSYVGGDAVRSWYAGNKGDRHSAFTATVLERYTGFVAMVVLAFAFVWFVDAATWAIKLMVLGITLALIILTLLALSTRLLEWLLSKGKVMVLLTHLKKIQQGLVLAKGEGALLLKTILLSFIFHFFTVVNTAVAAHAVGWSDVPYLDLFVVLPLIMLIGAVPLAPSGLGLQEGAFFIFLQALGATPAQALGVGLVLRAKSYVLALIGGLFWLSMRKEANKAQPD